MNLLAESIGLLGGAFGLTIAIPQTIRILRTKTHVGVSTSSWLILTLSVMSWATFGFRIESPSQIISNVIAMVFNGVLTWMLLRDDLKSRLRFSGTSAAVIIIALGAICSAIVWFSSELVMDIFLALFLTSRMPQIASSFTSWKIGRITVVSTTTYTLSTLSGVCWVVYGVLMQLPFVIVFSAVVALLSLLVLGLELLAKRKATRLASA